jgi:hypothetical protein
VAVLRRHSGLALAGAILALRCAIGYANPITEPQAKANLLFNLPGFVEWPADVLAEGSRLSICVAGDPDVLAALRPFEGQPMGGHVVTSRAIADDGDPLGCHIVFVSGAREQALGLVRRAADRPVLTVGDGVQFARQGGALRVFFEQARLRLEVNMTVAASTGLKLSSKMLRLARPVRSQS